MSIPKNPVLQINYSQNGSIFPLPPVVLGKSQSTNFEVNGFRFLISKREYKEKGALLFIIDEKSCYPIFEGETITFDKTREISISFTLISDFVRKDDRKFKNYLIYSILIHFVFFFMTGLLSPFQPKQQQLHTSSPQVDVTRVRTVLEKIKEREKKKEPIKFTQKIEKPTKVRKSKITQSKKKPRKKAPKDLALAQKAAELSRKKAELSKKLGFLSKTAGKFQIKVKDYKALPIEQYDKIAFTGSHIKAQKLMPSRSYDELGNIQTRGVRAIDQDIKVSTNGRVVTDGVRGGHIRGKVKVSDLYGSGGGEIGSSLIAHKGISLSGQGVISESVIEQILSKHIARLQYCYEKALLSNPTLNGTLKLEWTITTSGQTEKVKVVRSQLASQELHQCLIKEMEKIRFPAPKGGSVTVTKPFSFTSTSL